MIIVAGHLTVDPDRRAAVLADHRTIIAAARSAPGCLDFHLSADPLEPDRINVFERWDDVDAVEDFRGSGPDDDQQRWITDADAMQYEIAATTSLTAPHHD